MGYAFGLITYLIVTGTLLALSLLTIMKTAFSAHSSLLPHLLTERLIISVVVFGFIAYRTVPRIISRIKDRTPILPPRFLRESGYAVSIGRILVWLGILIVLSSLVFAAVLIAQNASGLPVGLFTGFGIVIVSIGLIIVEVLLLNWQNDQK